MNLFDPNQEVTVVERRLPHWSQAGAITFITWRTWDSMPTEVVREWHAERDEWLRQHGIDPAPEDRLLALDGNLLNEFRRFRSGRWNIRLDECHGACVLRRPELSDIVAKSLLHFDGERYVLSDFVVMPNHVHVLAAFPAESAMLTQCEAWKHFTATAINRALRRRGRFWQQDGFDHLVRSPEQLQFLQRYIADNPTEANLKPGEFAAYSSDA